MKLKLIFLSIFLTQILSAQIFTEAPLPSDDFEGIITGSIAFADVDDDNDLDVLITGEDNFANQFSTLYINDGTGTFTEKSGTPFVNVYHSSTAFADVDGDNDLDVLITGRNYLSNPVSKLYINDDGMGNFIEMPDTPIESVVHGSIAFADVDGDNDLDVLTTGVNSTNDRIAKLSINDGAGNFTEMTGTPFDGVKNSTIVFADVDGDGDPDVLITGENSSNLPISKLYTNDGAGIFTEMQGTPFEGVFLSSIAFADMDGDNDLDVLITGQNSSLTPTLKLYTNDGTGTFTELLGTSFDEVVYSSIAVADVDGDYDPDVLITGDLSLNDRIAKLYINDGAGNFTERMDTSFEGVQFSSISFTDVNGDDYPDVLISGINNSNQGISNLYINNGVVSSTEEEKKKDLAFEFSLDFSLYPNPASTGKLNLSYKALENESITLNLYDLKGILLSQQKVLAVTGQQTFAMDITALSAGTYFVQMDNEKGSGVASFIVP